MKILILGHAQHGKDTLAEILRDLYGLTFISSSIAALEIAVTPALLAAGLQYGTPEAAYNDRHAHRELWMRAITEFNTPDKGRLCRMILEKNDMYVGMRCPEEFEATKHLFDRIIWIERPGFGPDKTMKIPFDAHTMEVIVNAGDKSSLVRQARKLMERAA